MGNWYSRYDNEKKYVIFEEDDISKEFNSVAFGMLMNNSISSLIPCSISQTDNKRIINFNVSSYQNFQDILDKETTFDFISALFIDMCSSIIQLRKYMIETNNLIFDFDKLYVDPLAAKVKFLIDPFWNENKALDCRTIFRNIIVNLKLNKHDSQHIGTILSILNKKGFSVESFLEDLKKLDNIGNNESASPLNTQLPNDKMTFDPLEENDYSKADPQNISRHDQNCFERIPSVPNRTEHQSETNRDNGKGSSWLGKIFTKKKTSGSERASSLDGLAIPGQDDMNIQKGSQKSSVSAGYDSNSHSDVTFIEDDDDMTVVLTENKPFPKLINKVTHSVVKIDKDVFRIGRDQKQKLDFVISTKLVSHHHATIKFKRGSYYIIDENSTNHVFVNGKKIPVSSDYRLNNGDTIKIGSEEFVFEI